MSRPAAVPRRTRFFFFCRYDGLCILQEIAAAHSVAKFRSSIGRVNGIRFAVSFGVRLRAAGVRRQRTKRRLSSLARQTASQSPDQTAQSETRCLPAFKKRRQTPQTVVCAVRFYSSVCQARHKSRLKCPIACGHPRRAVERQKRQQTGCR